MIKNFSRGGTWVLKMYFQSPGNIDASTITPPSQAHTRQSPSALDSPQRNNC